MQTEKFRSLFKASGSKHHKKKSLQNKHRGLIDEVEVLLPALPA